MVSAGIVGSSIGMPDIHSGYGFAVGNVAAFDMDDPAAIVSPGGVGFDINCGVRLIRTGILHAQILNCCCLGHMTLSLSCCSACSLTSGF